jgi:hypothetical protein
MRHRSRDAEGGQVFPDPYYKARSERTDEAERGLIPAFRRTYNPEPELAEEDAALVEACRGEEQLPYTIGEALARREEAANDID